MQTHNSSQPSTTYCNKILYYYIVHNVGIHTWKISIKEQYYKVVST